MSDAYEDNEFYEEDFDDELVIEDDENDDAFELPEGYSEAVLTQVEPAPAPKKKDELFERFNPKSSAAIRLVEDFRSLKRSDPKMLGFSADPKENNLFVWCVKLFGFEKGTPIYSDMEKYKKMTGRDYVEFEIHFPPNYPDIPPFMRVVQPRFVFHKGRVTVGGSICNDILTMESWKPVYEIESLLLNVFTEILAGDPRIDFSRINYPYSMQGAKEAFIRVARDHGWKTSNWLPQD